MRIVWKDSKPILYKPVKYRKHLISGTPKGWTISIPDDNNLYASHYDAMNAIDKALGDYGQRGSTKRKNYKIHIIGKLES